VRTFLRHQFLTKLAFHFRVFCFLSQLVDVVPSLAASCYFFGVGGPLRSHDIAYLVPEEVFSPIFFVV
jgi:hypothetical protein